MSPTGATAFSGGGRLFPHADARSTQQRAGTNFGAEVRFSVESGTFLDPLICASRRPIDSRDSLSICAGPKRLRRTNVPTISSPLYTGPLRSLAQLRSAHALFKPGVLPGPPHTETYLSLDPSVLSFSSDLPIMVINNLGQGPSRLGRSIRGRGRV